MKRRDNTLQRQASSDQGILIDVRTIVVIEEFIMSSLPKNSPHGRRQQNANGQRWPIAIAPSAIVNLPVGHFGWFRWLDIQSASVSGFEVWIASFVHSQQIYSLPPLTTWVSYHCMNVGHTLNQNTVSFLKLKVWPGNSAAKDAKKVALLR